MAYLHRSLFPQRGTWHKSSDFRLAHTPAGSIFAVQWVSEKTEVVNEKPGYAMTVL